MILVSAGNFQEYIKTNIDQLLKFNFDIHIIIDNAFFKYMKDYKNLVNLVDANELHKVSPLTNGKRRAIVVKVLLSSANRACLTYSHPFI